MRKILASVIAWFVLAGAALAQTGPGQLGAWNVIGNPSASAVPSPGTSAALTTMLDGAFCNTNGSVLQRGASVWACTGTPALFGVTINPTAASTNQGFNVAQSGPTSGSGTGILNCLADLLTSYCFNDIVVSADAYNLANHGMNALAIDYAYGGSNMQGARNGLTVYSHLNNTGSPSNPNPFYGAINSVWEAFAPDTSSSAAVNITAFTLLQSGATGYHSIEGIEIDTGMVTTGGAAFRVGLDMASIGAFQGASGDYALAVSTGTGNVAWLNAIGLSHFNGAAPLDATNGCIICTDGNTDTIKTGIDFSAYTVSGNAFKSKGFQIDGSGNATENTTKTAGFLIAGLPTCNGGSQGLRAFVTNGATSPTFLGTVSATGAVVAPVFCNGTAWVYG